MSKLPSPQFAQPSATSDKGGSKQSLRTQELSESDILTLLALQQVEDLGIVPLRLLVSGVVRPAVLLKGELPKDSVTGLSASARRSLERFLASPQNSPAWRSAESTLVWMEKTGVSILPENDPKFPHLLRQTVDCPAFLYCRGDISILNKRSITIVGTRKPTAYGKFFAGQMAEDLASAGLVIVSGMARGIDSAAHAGALTAPGSTIAVWATGLDRVYPHSARQLAARIAESGAAISEMPPGLSPHKGLFPRRNRIVSGMSEGTIVVEAQRASGSLITARLALEQNREVFAVPGPVHSEVARGCHQLIKEGAVLVESARDVLEAMEGFRSLPLFDGQPRACGAASSDEQWHGLATDQQKILRLLGEEPLPFEILQSRSGLAVQQLREELIDLELQGFITQEGSFYQVLTNPRYG